MKKSFANLISWISTTGNGPKAFWSATGLICFVLLFRPAVSDEEITQKVLLLLSSPIITLSLFYCFWMFSILWTEVVFPVAKFLKKRFFSNVH